MNASASLPSAVSTRCIAASEPSASPSGFSCVVSTNCSASRSSSSMRSRAARAPFAPLIGGSSASSSSSSAMRKPRSDGVVVAELERRRVLEPQLAGHPLLEEAVRRAAGRPGERRRVALVPEHGDEDARMAQVWRCLDSSHGDEPDTRVLELMGDRVREDLLDGLVDPTHPLRLGHPIASRSFHDASRRSTRTPCGKRASRKRPTPSAISSARRAEPGDERHRERRALPGVLLADLGDRGPDAVAQVRLDAVELGPLALQRAGLGEEQVDPQHHDEGTFGHCDVDAARPCGYPSVRSTCRVS